VNLAGGLAGRAVFFTQLGLVDRAHSHFLRIAEETLHAAVDTLPRTEFVMPGLFTGLTGISWAVHHVSSLLELKEFQRAETYDDVFDFIDAYLQREEQYEYDLINGLVGVGTWALALPESERRTALLELVFELLPIYVLKGSVGEHR
jgi:lantibiotic modifying enzyme